jgi:hypothetical protein
MFGSIVLASIIQFGVVKGCSDPSIELLEEFKTEIVYLENTPELFPKDAIKIAASMPPICQVVNSQAEIEFDINNEGVIVRYKVLSHIPKRVHSKAIKKALMRTPVHKSNWGLKNNKVLVNYIQYKSKT